MKGVVNAESVEAIMGSETAMTVKGAAKTEDARPANRTNASLPAAPPTLLPHPQTGPPLRDVAGGDGVRAKEETDRRAFAIA